MSATSLIHRNRQARTEFWRLLQWFGRRYGLTRQKQAETWGVSPNALTRWSKGQASPATMLRVAVRVLQAVKEELVLAETQDLRPNRSLTAITRMVERSLLWPSEMQAIRAYALLIMQHQLVEVLEKQLVITPELVCRGLDYGQAWLSMGVVHPSGLPYVLTVGVEVLPGKGLTYITRVRRREGDEAFERRGRLTDRAWTQTCLEVLTHCKTRD